MTENNCQKETPKLPRKGTDKQEICDRYGNRWIFDADTKAWISKGVVTAPPVVTETNNGLVTTDIYSKLNKLRQIANSPSLKLLPGTDGYWYYFRTSDKTFRFRPEGENELRIEVDRGRIFQIFLKEKCPGLRGPTGPKGKPGLDGTPGFPELCYRPIYDRDRIDFTIFTPVPLTIGGEVELPNNHVPTIAVRLYSVTGSLDDAPLQNSITALSALYNNLSRLDPVRLSFEAARKVLIDRSLGMAVESEVCLGALNPVLVLGSTRTVSRNPLITIDISPVDPSEVVVDSSSTYPIDVTRTLESVKFDPATSLVCGSIFLESGNVWDESVGLCLKSRQRGPDGVKGDPGECRIKIVECVIDDTNILATCPIVNVRADCELDRLYTLCSDLIEDFCVDSVRLVPGSGDLVSTDVLRSVFVSAQVSLDDCKRVGRFRPVLGDVDESLELDLVNWDPQPGCFTQRHYDRYNFDWVPLTDVPACDVSWFGVDSARDGRYPFGLIIAPEPPEDECCQDDGFYCPNVQAGACGGDPPPPPPPPPDPPGNPPRLCEYVKGLVGTGDAVGGLDRYWSVNGGPAYVIGRDIMSFGCSEGRWISVSPNGIAEPGGPDGYEATFTLDFEIGEGLVVQDLVVQGSFSADNYVKAGSWKVNGVDQVHIPHGSYNNVIGIGCNNFSINYSQGKWVVGKNTIAITVKNGNSGSGNTGSYFGLNMIVNCVIRPNLMV